MAIGAATVAGRFGHDGRPIMHDIITFAGDGAYPSGGTPGFRAYVQQAVGRGSLDIVAAQSVDSAGYTVHYDRVNDKLKVTSSGTEVANATNLAATTFRVMVLSV